MTPDFEIMIDGLDVTKTFNPLLISLTTRQSTQGEGALATADIELDDTNGQIAVPTPNAQVQISLGYKETGIVEVFTGFVHDNGSRGSVPGKRHDHQKGHEASQGNRQQGRVFVITAYSGDLENDAKKPQEFHKDDSSFSDFISELAQKVGLQAQADDAIGQVQRKYWHAANESFLTASARYMRELGGTMQMFGNMVTFTSKNTGQSVSGQDLTGIQATWGYNLISWSIQPVITRPMFSAFNTRWYDMDEAAWKSEKADGASGSSGPETTGRNKAATSDNAQQNSSSDSAASDQDKGGADEVTIDGGPTAQCNATCVVSGIRDGVDDTYTITSVVHHLSRQSGFITSLGLSRPQGADSSGSSS